MAALTPQFKIKHGLEQGELAIVVNANFSKWAYWLSIKHHMQEKWEKYFFANMILNIGRLLGKQMDQFHTWEDCWESEYLRQFYTSYFGRNDGVWWLCVWTISGQVDREGWVGLQNVPKETSRAHRPPKADGWCIWCLWAAERRISAR